jgi:hypothetical protein
MRQRRTSRSFISSAKPHDSLLALETGHSDNVLCLIECLKTSAHRLGGVFVTFCPFQPSCLLAVRNRDCAFHTTKKMTDSPNSENHFVYLLRTPFDGFIRPGGKTVNMVKTLRRLLPSLVKENTSFGHNYKLST